jgi:bifunctional non-homologous end joining protein LigD
MNEDRLRTYRDKRDFAATSEPDGGRAVSSGQIFVMQKHRARSLHYDLRLEVEGVLKSWAVPKGPSADPRDKRLAIETEDHPLEYASFEGVIPEGQYGAGAVIVWDTGLYRNITQKEGRSVPMAEALQNGHAAIWLEGKKLSGGYALTRTQRGWILVKMKDDLADSSRDILKTLPRSVLSGRTVEEVAEDRVP